MFQQSTKIINWFWISTILLKKLGNQIYLS
jgi:hypothetical protein